MCSVFRLLVTFVFQRYESLLSKNEDLNFSVMLRNLLVEKIILPVKQKLENAVNDAKSMERNLVLSVVKIFKNMARRFPLKLIPKLQQMPSWLPQFTRLRKVTH